MALSRRDRIAKLDRELRKQRAYVERLRDPSNVLADEKWPAAIKRLRDLEAEQQAIKDSLAADESKRTSRSQPEADPTHGQTYRRNMLIRPVRNALDAMLVTAARGDVAGLQRASLDMEQAFNAMLNECPVPASLALESRVFDQTEDTLSDE